MALTSKMQKLQVAKGNKAANLFFNELTQSNDNWEESKGRP
jgi:hypothetical protein